MSSCTNPLQKPPNLAFPTLGVIILALSPCAHWAFVPVGANEEEEKSLEGVRNSDSAATRLVSWELGLLPPVSLQQGVEYTALWYSYISSGFAAPCRIPNCHIYGLEHSCLLC